MEGGPSRWRRRTPHDGGAPSGCNNLAVLYQNARGVARNQAKAAALYERACEAGHALGCANLGAMVERGHGVPKDTARAATLYKRACDGGNLQGCSNLGTA
jgi:TPR repeat protein